MGPVPFKGSEPCSVPAVGRWIAHGALLAVTGVAAQVPTQCLEIESILVDACVSNTLCPGSLEAMNEMVRFKVGPDPLFVADLDVDWPNNSFLGFTQDAQTAQLTAELNSSIQGCGWLLEPSAGILPAGSTVLVITSVNMCTAANSFAGLTDTLRVIYQTAGNSSGHFGNHNNGGIVSPVPSGPSDPRTLIVTHTPTACADTVTYDRSLLVNVYGTYGGFSAENDGSTALFSWPGVPDVSYVNYGCQAPFEPLVVSIDTVMGSLCSGGSIVLSASIIGPIDGPLWSGGSGVFSDPDSVVTTYTAGPQDQGPVDLTFCVLSSCGEPVCATVQVTAGTSPSVVISGDTLPCTGTITQLVASGADSYLWSTGEMTDTIAVNTDGVITVTGTNACGSADTSVTITFQNGPDVQVTSSGDLCPDATLTAVGADSYVWITGDTTASIVVDTAGTYSVIGTNDCGLAGTFIVVQGSPLVLAFTADTLLGEEPLTVQFTNQSQPPDAVYGWDFGDGATSLDPDPSHTFVDPGVYNVVLTGTLAGCVSQSVVLITVLEVPSTESNVSVPNVFSPNRDGVNDVLEVDVQNIARMEMSIYDRWGHRVALLERPRQVWDARTIAGEPVSEGTYFYVLTAEGTDGVSHDLRGTVTVLR